MYVYLIPFSRDLPQSEHEAIQRYIAVQVASGNGTVVNGMWAGFNNAQEAIPYIHSIAPHGDTFDRLRVVFLDDDKESK